MKDDPFKPTLGGPRMAKRRLLTGLACVAAIGIAQADDRTLPLHIQSSGTNHSIMGEIDATVPEPFARTAAALKEPRHWCDILLLHLDTKDCLVTHGEKGTVLRVGVVTHYDQPPSSAYRADFEYTLAQDNPDFLRARLDADDGPLDTKDYRIVVEARPADGGGTAIHLSYSYSFGLLSRVALQAYMLTFGRNKVGFTVTGTQSDGTPKYIGGMRGIVERNTMRYYVAVAAYLAALSAPPEARIERALHNWYVGIERYPRQLHEMEEPDYLAMKRREFGQR